MEKAKLLYISLLLTGLALVSYSARLLVSRAELKQPQRSMLVKEGDDRYLRVDLFNQERSTINYTISVFIEGERYNESILLRPGRSFTYIRYLYPPIEGGVVKVQVYRGTKPAPESEAVYVIEG